jgi:hypothetical protein
VLRPFVAKTGGNQGMAETRVSDLPNEKKRNEDYLIKTGAGGQEIYNGHFIIKKVQGVRIPRAPARV